MSDSEQSHSRNGKLGVAGSAVWTQGETGKPTALAAGRQTAVDIGQAVPEASACGSHYETASPTDDSTRDRNPVDALADEFAARIRNGESPSIEEFVQRLPEHAAAIRVLFPSIAMMERVSHQEHAESRLDQQTVRLTGAMPHTLGDFRILREIGRGGMGIVYEAEQRSLGRRVALKVISPTSTGSTNQLARFQREAEAAARLHHTNIVPVFGIGEDNGLHYFAMQLIEGVPLSEFIEIARPARSTQTQGDRSNEPSVDGHQMQPTATSVAIAAADVDSDALPPTVERPLDDDVDSFQRSASRAFNAGDAERPRSRSHAERGNELGPTMPEASAYGSRRDHFRHVATMVRDVASALSYAHQHGVLHRDVKPANLLLDRSGVVWMTDFGLARRDDHDNVTQTGDIVGTLRYMAPEQFSGETDERSDICSLGLTLFELLTLMPACAETRHGPLIKARTESGPPAPRSVDPAIPIELDTIAQKAAALAPEDRYQTAADLADDLQRYLDDRPIRARRMRWHERVRRWARRNPAVAALSVTATVLMIAVAVTFAIGRHEAQQALGVAETHRIRAEKNLALGIAAFEKIIDNIAARGVSPSVAATAGEGEVAVADSVLTVADVRLLESLLEFFDQFATENDSGTARIDAVAARKRVGDIQQRLGRSEDADVTYQQTLEAYAGLHAEFPDDPGFVIAQADILNEMAVSASRRTDIDTASNLHESARELLEESPATTQTEAGRFELARTLTLFASIGQRAGLRNLFDASRPGSLGRGPSGNDGRPRPPGHGTSRDDNGRPNPRPPGPRPSGGDEGDARPDGSGPSEPGPFEEDDVQTQGPAPKDNDHDNARSRGRSGPGGRPPKRGGRGRAGSPPGRGRSNDSDRDDTDRDARVAGDPREHGRRGSGGWPGRGPRPETGRMAEAARTAVELLTDLVSDFPDNTTYRLWLARAYRARSGMRFSFEDHNQTAAALQSAVTALERLSEEHPDQPELQFELADMLCMPISIRASADTSTQGALMADTVRPLAPGASSVPTETISLWLREQAIPNVERAIAICEELTSAHPNSREYQALHGTALSRLASLRQSSHEIASAADAWHAALQIQRPLAERFPNVTLYRVACAQSLQQLAEAERRLGNDSSATTHLDEAIALLKQTELPDDIARFLDRFVDRLKSRRRQLRDDSPPPIDAS